MNLPYSESHGLWDLLVWERDFATTLIQEPSEQVNFPYVQSHGLWDSLVWGRDYASTLIQELSVGPPLLMLLAVYSPGECK